MPTPASGTISMNDMRTHINRATSSSISMSEMRTRYGGSGAISFSDLYDTEGFIITCGSTTTKFGTADGFDDSSFSPIGSVAPDEGNGRVQFASASWLQGFYSPAYDNTIAGVVLAQNSTADVANGSQVTAGYKVTDLTRIVAANTSYSINSATSGDDISSAFITYNFPSSGTVHCLLKF